MFRNYKEFVDHLLKINLNFKTKTYKCNKNKKISKSKKKMIYKK